MAKDNLVAPPRLSYDLSETSPVEVLLELADANAAGQVTFQFDGRSCLLSIEAQKIRHAERSDSDSRLGTLMVAEGLITEPDLDRVLEMAQRSGQPLGMALVESGLASPLDVHEGLSLQVAKALELLVSLDRGTATFSLLHSEHEASLEIPIRRALFETLRRTPGPDPFAKTGGPDTLIDGRFGPKDLFYLGLDEDEFKLVSLANGKRRLEELIYSGPLSAGRNQRVLAALLRLGLLTTHRPGSVRLRPADSESQKTRKAGHSDLRLVPSPGPSPGEALGSAAVVPPAEASEHQVAAPEQALERLFGQAMSAYLERDYPAALALFERRALEAPHDQRVRHNIARIREKLTDDGGTR